MRDLIGQRFGRLLVLKVDEIKHKHKQIFWFCKCDCGNTISVFRGSLVNGFTKSCGCYRIEVNKRPRRLLNTYNKVDENTMVGYTSKHFPFYFDTEDYDKIKEHSWNWNGKSFIAVTNKKFLTLQGLLLNVSGYYLRIIYKDKDHSNNKKSNLEVITNSQFNRKLFKNNKWNCNGIYQINNLKSKKWVAHIKVNHKDIYLGCFTKLKDAINARKEAEKKYNKK